MDKNSHVNDRRVGDGNFRTSQNPTLNRSPKNLLQVITLAAPMSVPHLVQTRPWGLLGNEWNITIFYLYFFFGNSPTRQTRRRIFTLGGSNDADSRKGVLFGVWFILLAILEMKSSKTPNFFGGGGENRRFQAKQPKYWKFHTVNTTASISTKFCKKIETTKLSSWVVLIGPLRARQIQAGGGRHFVTTVTASLQIYDHCNENWHGETH